MTNMRYVKWAVLLVFALAIIGADDCSTGDSGSLSTSSSSDSSASSSSSSDDAPEANPDGEYELNCEYVLGDFGESGDPKKGFRFIGGGTLKNTGNVGIVVRVRYKWLQIGESPLVVKKTYRVRRGEERDVNVTVPVNQSQIDAIQAAPDPGNDCSTKATIIDSFGTPR